PEQREIAADDHAAIGLQRDCVDLVVRAGEEPRIDRSIAIQPADVSADRSPRASAAEHREAASDDNPAVGLHGKRRDLEIRARIEAVDGTLSERTGGDRHDDEKCDEDAPVATARGPHFTVTRTTFAGTNPPVTVLHANTAMSYVPGGSE